MSTEGFSTSLRPVAIELELRFGTHSERVRGLLVGQRKPEYLIVEISRKHNWTEVQEWFLEASTVVVRGVLAQGQIIAAVATFLSVVSRPQRMVFLTYPERFETRILRQTPRLEVDLDAVIRGAPNLASPFSEESGLTEIKGAIKDISRGGISFETKAIAELENEDLSGAVVEIEIFDEERSLLKIQGEIRGTKQGGDDLTLGLLVDRDDKQFSSSLNNLVLHSKLIKQAIKG
ncbi:PilZ domain-containing protein [Aliidiomarina quisquiliarum]|uniref:PilZ domain-containing protein n=1 Tax=Aliidiomarina quisquiliarum TaxID=2938947 RepID=UPI00208EBCAD|nr:PilZ domain-containing protein [Aliidiomarina quisquiliarum]MCO4322653.1 flagellar brake protein [Aliidiomarina quisquiliarum]